MPYLRRSLSLPALKDTRIRMQMARWLVKGGVRSDQWMIRRI